MDNFYHWERAKRNKDDFSKLQLISGTRRARLELIIICTSWFLITLFHFHKVGQKILSRSSDGMCHSSKSGVFTGQWSGCLLSKHVGDKQMWNILLNYYQNRSKWIYYSFWHSLWINVYKNKMFVKWLKAWEWWQGDPWPQVATKNYWTEGEPLAPRSYQLMIALVLSSPKTQNSFQPSRPEIDINNGQNLCIKYQKNHLLKIC